MTTSKHARAQRKAMFNAPLHKKRKMIASHLSDELFEKYGVRSLPVIKGDIVKIMRGDIDMKDKEAEVVRIYTKEMKVALEGINIKKADASEVSKKLHPSNLLIVKLNLSDQKRKEKLDFLSGGEV